MDSSEVLGLSYFIAAEDAAAVTAEGVLMQSQAKKPRVGGF
jgi:hypothetical protein